MLVAQSAFVITKFLQFSSLFPSLEPEMLSPMHYNSKLCFGIIQARRGWGVCVPLYQQEGKGMAISEKYYSYVGVLANFSIDT